MFYSTSVRYAAICLFTVSFISLGARSQDILGPKAVPATRAEMLKALDAIRHREARLPLPDAEASPTASAPVSPNAGPPVAGPVGAGSLGVVNNGRLRSLYLPKEFQTRTPQPPGNASDQLPYEFSTELFWIVSRVNNCHYCLGHQEAKLQAVGVTEQTLLELDTDWSKFPVSQAAAFKFARKLTFAPQSISDQDIDALRTHFTDQQILEIAYLVGRYNSTNRWTDSLGIPQEGHREFTSALAESEVNLPSQVAIDGFPERVGFDSYASWKSEFEKQSTRKPRLEFADADSGNTLLPHAQLLASLPAAGSVMTEQLKNAALVGELPNSLRNKIAFVAAREDRAWYMQHVARQRLLSDGLADEMICSLGNRSTGDSDNVDSGDDVALRFAKKLTIQPQSMTDGDIEELSKHFSVKQIAEIVYHTGLAAMLDRLTEVAGLGWQP